MLKLCLVVVVDSVVCNWWFVLMLFVIMRCLSFVFFSVVSDFVMSMLMVVLMKLCVRLVFVCLSVLLLSFVVLNFFICVSMVVFRLLKLKLRLFECSIGCGSMIVFGVFVLVSFDIFGLFG